MSVSTRTFIPELQSLRGIASAIVMVGHACQYYDNPAWFHRLSLLLNGRAAVVIFFVLSGYVLTRSLVDTTLDRATLLQFYVRRVFRIYPALWLASIVALLYLLFLHWNIVVPKTGDGIRHQFRPDRMDFIHIAASFIGALAFLLPQGWSIFVEIVASAALPWTSFIAKAGKLIFSLTFLLALCLSYFFGQQTYYGLGLYLPDFLFGSVLVVFRDNIAQLLPRLPRQVSWLLIGLSALLTTTQYLPTEYYSFNAHLVESVLATSLIAVLVYDGRGVSALQTPSAIFLGDISYSVYLLHYVVLCTIAKLLHLVVPFAWEDNTILLTFFLVVLTIPVTIILSWLSYVGVEQTGIRMGSAVLQLTSWTRRSDRQVKAGT